MNNMEQLNLFEYAGLDEQTGLPAATYTKQELIAYYKEMSEYDYKYGVYLITTGYCSPSANMFLSFILKQKP